MSKKGHAGGVNAYFPNLFFHIGTKTIAINGYRLRQKEKKCKVPEKRGILLTHQNFGKNVPIDNSLIVKKGQKWPFLIIF